MELDNNSILQPTESTQYKKTNVN